MPKAEEQKSGPGRPRDPNLAERRSNEILRQAVLHFAKNGYPGTDVGAVAESAGCSKGTVYNYFSSKCELFRESVDYVMEGLLEAMPTDDDGDPIERIGRSVQTFLTYFDEHPEYIELLIQERAQFKDRDNPAYYQYHDSHREQKRQSFKRLIASGRVRDVHVDRTLTIIGNLLYGTIFNNYFEGRTISLEQQAADITDILLNGLLTPEEKQSDPGQS